MYRYRADLDGLRAVAILCVVLFHAYPQLLPGGLLGVDLFFVLSGYLITQLLQRQGLAARVGVWHFYRQRLQRLYPPLLLFLSTMLVLAYFMLDSAQYSALWFYGFSASVFTTNLYLAVDQGLLSDGYAHNPFLHLWSLGIEGQLYLLWPLIALYRCRLFLAGILSIGSAGVLYAVGADSWLFYAPSSRLFEMAAGAALALYGKRLPQHLTAYSNGLLLSCFVLGLLLINPYQPYPTSTVLLPVAAAALFIINAPQSALNQALSCKLLVYIGRVSYSWYLWHWGLLALYQTHIAPWVLLGLSFVLAMLSYHGVEQPLQQRRRAAA